MSVIFVQYNWATNLPAGEDQGENAYSQHLYPLK